MAEFPGIDVEPESGDEFAPPLVDEADLILPQDQIDNGLTRPAPGSPPREPFEGSGSVPSFPLSPTGGLPERPLGLVRPYLRRDGSVPAPRQPPPPTPLPQAPSLTGELTGSPSLMKIKKMINELPRLDPTPYAFIYRDAAGIAEELEEWFPYTIEEQAKVAVTHSSFLLEWSEWNETTPDDPNLEDWTSTSAQRRSQFMIRLKEKISQRAQAIQDSGPGADKDDAALEITVRSLEALVYLVLGCWHETAGLGSPESPLPSITGKEKAEDEDRSSDKNSKTSTDAYGKSKVQLDWVRTNTLMFLENDGAKVILDIFKITTEREFLFDTMRLDNQSFPRQLQLREVWSAETVLYVCLEVVRTCEDEKLRTSLRSDFLSAKPSLLVFLSKVINDLRWDDSVQLPMIKIALLTWKSVLVLLGAFSDVEKVKESFQEKNPARDNLTKPLITASPLEYHSFRQEISSKYPAYNPPPATFQLEPEQKSMLPPLRANQSRPASVVSSHSDYGGSILHQPVHIATPAPSPPPSPAAKGKKQNYQTNQLFPFLYPPLDSASNQIGGKGTTSLQDNLVNRRWLGSDVPASILEASELFASRIRATRALKQLWDARTEFLQFDRGWADGEEPTAIPELNLDEDVKTGEDTNPQQDKVEQEERKFDGSVEDRLQTVEEYYRDGLPYLQSLVMAFVKTIMTNLTTLMTHYSLHQNGAGNVGENQNGNGALNGSDGVNGTHIDKLSLEDLETFRVQEIMAKASSGLILLLLKWFKVSHVLKFEYMTQLLVDANFIPIVLKLFQTQETGKLINYRMDRVENSFFENCWKTSRNFREDPPAAPSSEEIESEDEAIPPPIARHRSSDPKPSEAVAEPTENKPTLPPWPEVDELGVPTSEFPNEPITTYSWRNFFSIINYLRILQKVCKNKAHRNLMLVTYKSAAYLKKSLKVPQRELRLYTLKLFKNQVPYCGRKWRSSNMRVITAVYLYCRPELRDDWLLSTDVDNDVEQAVPMEQSLRSLTHFYNLKHYAKQMGAQADVLSNDSNFFMRELEKMDWIDGQDLEDQMSVDHQNWGTGVHHLEHM